MFLYQHLLIWFNSAESLHRGDVFARHGGREARNQMSYARFVSCVLHLVLVEIVPCAGTGECGKSTILKQMKILHLDGFTDEEKAQYRLTILQNTVESIQALLQACESMNLRFDSADNQVCCFFGWS